MGRCKYYLTYIARNTVYLIRSPDCNQTQAPACWSVKICDRTHDVKMGLLNPLTNSELKLVPGNFPLVLDLNNFQVIQLGHVYIAEHVLRIDHSLEPQTREYREKVVYLQSNTDRDDFTVLASVLNTGRLAFLRSSEKDWTVLDFRVQNIITFNGEFYALVRKGRTIVIDQSLNVSSLEPAESFSGTMFLVECVDNLLAVEMLFDTDVESTMSYGRFEGEKVVGFKVFKMNEEEQRWDEMGSLGIES
ncbi:hypothetical protein V6N13_115226 [Hibiscus sabdariffa]|uniref:KIB1-4 beta-propeller domain-containing protein n=1 Tax=Hibiscus sabdariffa TaxID=183260 RepID=A0ABR2CR48_9ROSI